MADHLIAEPLPLERYVAAIGRPTNSISAEQPAPHGYRNNEIHLYDQLGLYLNEDHATRTIGEVTFVLDESRSTFPIEKPLQGELDVGGVLFHSGMTEQEYPRKATIKFECVLPGKWKAEKRGIAIYLSASKEKSSSARRTHGRTFNEVSICFG
jgi:hypothetical protein